MSEIMEIFGVRVDAPASNVVGSISTSPATRPRLNAAAKRWPEIRWTELGQRDNFFVDRASGALYRRFDGDPLLASPGATVDVSMWAESPNAEIVFLRRDPEGRTVADLDSAAEAVVQQRQAAEEKQRQFLANQPRRTVLLSDAHGREFPTLRDAARMIAEHGGQIRRGKWGEVKVELPQILTADPIARAWGERETRTQLARAAEALTYCERVVLAALEEKSSKPLHERLPDGVPTIGGGVA